jgi:hypothetical protein
MLRRQTSKIPYQPGDRLWLAALSRASMAARTAPTTPGFKACMMGKSSAAWRVTIPRPSRGRARPRQKTIGPPLAGNLDRAFGDDDQRAGLVGAVGGWRHVGVDAGGCREIPAGRT